MFDPREDLPKAENFKPRWVAVWTIVLNLAILFAAYVLFRIAPRSPWPVIAEFVGFYAVCGGIILSAWGAVFRNFVPPSMLRPGSRLGYLDKSMTITAFLVVPLILFFMVNSLFRFL